MLGLFFNFKQQVTVKYDESIPFLPNSTKVTKLLLLWSAVVAGSLLRAERLADGATGEPEQLLRARFSTSGSSLQMIGKKIMQTKLTRFRMAKKVL